MTLHALLIPAFIAGCLTFLAPCTLPLVPGYLAFISGISLSDKENILAVKKKVFINALLYVSGFSLVFIFMGSLVGLGGGWVAQYRTILSRIGGACIIIFGLYILKIIRIDFLAREKQFRFVHLLAPGKFLSSFLFGVIFAFGWSPCIGPVLGSVLTLAGASGTVKEGALLLLVFSVGLGLPFILIALGIGSATKIIYRLNRFLPTIEKISGAFLILIGILLLTNTFGIWVGYFYQLFDFLNYNQLLNYL